jgi:hypothetical protein
MLGYAMAILEELPSVQVVEYPLDASGVNVPTPKDSRFNVKSAETPIDVNI